MPAERIAAENVVIIGSGPAGLSTARAYRGHGGRGTVALVGEESLFPYERPPLTKEFLRGRIDESQLRLEEPEWFARRQVELFLGVPAAAIELARGAVVLADGRTLPADAVVLATGSQPVRPALPGADNPAVLTMRRLSDSRRVAAQARGGGEVVVVGSGFIGCEIAGSLAREGMPVTLIGQERLAQEDRLGIPVAQRLSDWLAEAGVTVIGEASLRGIEGGASTVVELEDGRRVEAACVVLATGVRPRGELATEAGLATLGGAVLVDSAMRSAHPAILAAGDVALAHNAAAGRALRVEHWGDALAQGKLAGRTLAGLEAEWDEVPGFWSTIGERTLKYAAWEDGYDELRLVEHSHGAFTAWYGREGTTVGVLTHERDADYERGRQLVAQGRPLP